MKKIFQIVFYIPFLILFISHYSCNKDETVITPIDPNDNRITIYDAEPSWSHDGNSIIYINDENGIGRETLIAIDTNSSNKRTLLPYFAESPSWSPDGQWILFEKDKKIYKKRVGGDTTTIQMTYSGVSYTPSWSKDGQWIAFSSDIFTPGAGYFICIMRADGTGLRRILSSNSLLSLRMPDWFPDGIHLVVTHFRSGGSFLEIAIIDTSGALIANLTNDMEDDYDPKVSPNGQYITWWKNAGNGTIYTMKVDGTQVTQLTKKGLHPCWSPDSQNIAYTNTTYQDGRIWIVNKNTGIKKKITN